MDPPHPAQLATHPDSTTSSPREWDDHHHQQPLAPIPGGVTKLRLMCSYGGHIIPRPHDKSLCYVGGDTRIVVVDRQSSLADIHARLGQTLLNGRHFTLKYQLPNEDLDSLISIATDEDMDNMLEEYDRCFDSGSSPLRPSRLRLFLFPTKPETAASMGSLLDDAKSETWFVDALNGSGLLPRGLSDSAAIDNNLLELEESIMTNNNDDNNNNNNNVDPGSNLEDSSSGRQVVVMEMNSSFGSSSSSPSMAHLPQIKVRVEDQEPVSMATYAAVAATPPLPDGKLRKPPLPLQPVQRKFVDIHNLPSPDSKQGGVAIYNLPSPDSVASDCSIASAGSLSKHTAYQDATQNRVPTPIDSKLVTQEPNSHVPMQQQQLTDHSVNSMQQPPPQPQYIQQQQQQQHPNPNPNTHYIPSYYQPMYLPQQAHQSSFHPQAVDPQHYGMYLMDPATGRPVLTQPPNPMVQQMYQPKPEMASNMPSPAATAAPVMYQLPPQYHQQPQQQQYIGVSQIPPQAAQGHSNYGYDQYSQQAMQDQMYYGQHQASTAAVPPTQYQSITPAAAAALMSQAQATPQLAVDATAQQS